MSAAASTARSTSSPARDRRWLALALLCAAQFVVVLDASIVNVALPSIGKELRISRENLSWVVNAYTLAFGGFLLLGGRTADLLGRRRVFMVGLVVFGTASLVGGFAQSEAWLIICRAVQGLGAAILSPAALSIVTTTFTEGAERNKALGVWGAVAGSGGAAGVLLGGVLTDGLGWEWVLWVMTPVAFAAAALCPRLITESRAQDGARRFDALGALTVTLGLVVLVYAVVDSVNEGFGSTRTLGLLALAAVLLGAFLAIESRSNHALLPLRMFRLRSLSSANVVGLLVGASLFSMFYFISLYMQNVLGYGPLKAGLSYLPLAVSIIVSAGAASQLVTKVGTKPILVTGLLLIAAGLLWFSRVSPDGTFVGDVLFPSLLAAVGLGFSFVPVTIAAVAGVREREAGLASGLINTSQQVGGALGLAILATIANSTIRDETAAAGGAREAIPGALTAGFSDAFLVGAGFALVGALVAFLLIPQQRGSDVQASPVAA